MCHMLKGRGLWKLVEGTERLKTNPSAKDIEQFQSKQDRAFAQIVMCMAPAQLYLVTSTKTPQEAWKALCRQYERNTLTNRIYLKKRYFRMEMKEGSSLQEHLRAMKELTDQMAVINCEISQEDQVVTLLGSLPRSYATLVTTLEARQDELDLVAVQQALIHEDMKLKGEAAVPSDSGDGDIALALKGRRQPGKSCYGCGQVGHFHRNCPISPYQGPSKEKKTTHFARPTVHDEVADDDCAFTLTKCVDGRSSRWLIDSGATSHMTWDKSVLRDYHQFDKPQRVGLGDGRPVNAEGYGSVKLITCLDNGTSGSTQMSRVLYVPDLTTNLFSVKTVTEKGCKVEFEGTICRIWDKNGYLKGVGCPHGKLFELQCDVESADTVAIANGKSDVIPSTCSEMDLWHRRLAHVNGQLLSRIVKGNLIDGVKVSKPGELSFCEGCVQGKLTRKPFKATGIRATRKLQLVHSDVCGPMSTKSFGGMSYFVTFTDDYSRCSSVMFMKNKFEVLEKFKAFEAQVTRESGNQIGVIRTDNGGEYVSNEFKEYLKRKGIRHETSVPYTPEQNGVAERLNRTLCEKARSMIAHAKLPKKFWAEAVATSAYLKNRLPTRSVKSDITPFELWYGRKPDLSHVRVYGCIAYALKPDVQRRKMDDKAVRLRFVGYDQTCKGYRLMDENGKIYKRRDVAFNEYDFGNLKVTDEPQSGDTMVLGVDKGKPRVLETDQLPEPAAMKRPERRRGPPVRFMVDEYVDTAADLEVEHLAMMTCQIDEPATLEEALSNDNASQWKAAVDAEHRSLMDNETWELVELPPNRKPIGCKWVFKAKYGEDGTIEKFKARLVAKGFAQKHGVDYEETFSPVVKFASIRTLLAMAVQKGWHVHQMDVITAFLNGDLDEEIYMQQPDGYVKLGEEELVCRLRKSLYGLKQSPRCWNTKFKLFMKEMDFHQSSADPCVFVKFTENGILIIAVYVDDLIPLGSDINELLELKRELSTRFHMKDMGELHFCLGIGIIQDKEASVTKLHQKQYIQRMIEKYGMKDANPVTTPADVNVKLVKQDGVSKHVDKALYQSIIGSLLYAAIATRPDIAQAVSVVSRFCSEPTEMHLTAAKRVLRYLKGTQDMCIMYSPTEEYLCGYSDANWAGDLDDRRSTTGNLFMLANGPVSWLSKKQATVALSTSEAEYIALSSATQEVVWLRRLLCDVSELDQGPTVIYEDNQGTIALAKNPVSHSRTKHIDIRHHFIREATESEIIIVEYCPTKEMLADMLTKPLHRAAFDYLRLKMGLMS